ncbi:hypothetical protein RclHR1_10820001 [Rhizophagus clarus]|uniref:Uncharacterized protein n=1 Tax=Rhizophagus clarus TaxID=94130 RepID=A0A2Z6Q446_9GLOM|nr:hypothetical protein RclHR1_10820001 [Rhizophagus clarus]
MAASRSNLTLFYLFLAKDLHINIKLDQMDGLSFSIKNIEFPLLDIWMKSYNDGRQKEWIAVQTGTTWLIGRITNKSFNDCKGLYVIDLYREVFFDHIWNCYYVKDKDTHTVVWPKDTLVMFQLNVTFSMDRNLDLELIKVKAHILHQQLPVGRWLRKRKPSLYQNFNCQFCNNEADETISHLITCPDTAHLRQSIYEALQAFLADTLTQFSESLSSATLVASEING